MPTYGYVCLKCGHRYEELERYEDKQEKCPNCSETALKRLIDTGIPPIFKGGGWTSPRYRPLTDS